MAPDLHFSTKLLERPPRIELGYRALQAQKCVPGRPPVSMNSQVKCIVGHRRISAFGGSRAILGANGSSRGFWEQDSDLLSRGPGLGGVSGPVVYHRPTTGIITPAGRCGARGGPMLLATAWSLGTGKRQWRRQQKTCSATSHLSPRPRIRNADLLLTDSVERPYRSRSAVTSICRLAQ